MDHLDCKLGLDFCCFLIRYNKVLKLECEARKKKQKKKQKQLGILQNSFSDLVSAERW